MTTPIKTVALAGASGRLGGAILKALLEADFTVTVLIRPNSTATYSPGVHLARVDYTDPADIKSALYGQDAVISAVGFAGILDQEALITAAVAAGVQRVIPSEFGIDVSVPAVRNLPVFAEKARVEEHLKRTIQGTPTSYTFVCNSQFIDWSLDHGSGVDIRGRRIEILDGGDVVRTVTPLEFVARGVVAVLRHPAETANRVVRLHGAAITLNWLLATVQRLTGEKWEVEQASTAEREEEGYRNLKADPGNWVGWAVPLIQAAVWGERFGGDFSRNNDNALLGLKELTNAEIEEIVRIRI